MAKACVTKLQAFLKENAEKVKSVVGDNAAAQAAVDALISIDAEDGLAGLIGELENKAAEVKDSTAQAVQNAADAAQDAAKQKVEETKEAAKQKAGQAIDNAASDAKKKLGL